MLKIAMDTAGDLAPGWEQEYQIDLIPINIIHGEKSYLQGIDLKYEDFYKLVDTSGTIPSTSQPTPYQFVEFYRRIAKKGDTVLSIHVTEKLSGTVASAKEAAKELKGEIDVLPIDSASGTTLPVCRVLPPHRQKRRYGSLGACHRKIIRDGCLSQGGSQRIKRRD